MSTLVFWDVTPCGLVGKQQTDFSPEDGGSMFLRNVANFSTKRSHGVTIQKTDSDIFAVRTSNLTMQMAKIIEVLTGKLTECCGFARQQT
jgi:hypothetical protein